MRIPVVVATLSFLATTTLFAADGAIPIWKRTHITEPGHYVVTRDITESPYVIQVYADNVTLDLNGHTLTTTGAPTVEAFDVRGLVIRNGTIVNDGSGMALYIHGGGSLTVENIHATGRGTVTARLEDCLGFKVTGTRLTNEMSTALYVTGCQDGIIEDLIIDYVEGRGLAILDGDRIHVSRVIFRAQTPVDIGIDLECDGCVVEDCIIEGALYGIYANASGSRISGNLLRGCNQGLVLNGTGNRVVDNVISAITNGILVNSTQHIIEGNLFHGSGAPSCGLKFNLGSNGSVYRANVARGHSCSCGGTGTTDFCDEGTGNTSHGDNYMPDKM